LFIRSFGRELAGEIEDAFLDDLGEVFGEEDLGAESAFEGVPARTSFSFRSCRAPAALRRWLSGLGFGRRGGREGRACPSGKAA